MGKTRGFFKKIRDTKRTFHANTGLINDRNGKDLTEAEETKMKWQEYTELYKKALNDLEPDILQCKVRWNLGSITINEDSGGDGIPSELFQILKDDGVKCCTQCVR